jgi:hypothetical protein
MKISTMSFLTIPMLVAGSIALSGCGRSSSNPTNISYRQVGICKGYETPAGPITAAANEGFAVFTIESVDNTKYGSSFSLTPERLYVNQSTPAQEAGQVSNWNRRFVHPDPRFAQTMGFASIPQTTIPAELCRKLGDDGLRKAAYRGWRPNRPESPKENDTP